MDGKVVDAGSDTSVGSYCGIVPGMQGCGLQDALRGDDEDSRQQITLSLPSLDDIFYPLGTSH
jgi:hypothetical protein